MYIYIYIYIYIYVYICKEELLLFDNTDIWVKNDDNLLFDVTIDNLDRAVQSLSLSVYIF